MPNNSNFYEYDGKTYKIIKEDLHFKRVDVDYNEAKKLLKDEPYKLEMINELNIHLFK